MARRPPHVKPPAYLSPNPPLPRPADAQDEGRELKGEDPTRYGDWTLKGVAVDF